MPGSSWNYKKYIYHSTIFDIDATVLVSYISWASHLGRHCGKELHLFLRGVGPGDQHVVEDGLFVDVEAGGDGPQPVGPERVLGVDEDNLAAAVAGRSVRHLRRHAQRVRELRLPRAELAERLGDGHGLDAAAEDRVELGASRRQAEHGLSIYARLESGDEVSATLSESFPFLMELFFTHRTLTRRTRA